MSGLANPFGYLGGADEDLVSRSTIVAQDGPYGWRVPQTSAQVVSLGAPAPAHLHPFQDASATAVDVVGDMPYTAANGPAFQTPETGWARMGIAFDGTTVEQCLYAAAGLGPDLGTEDFAHLIYLKIKPTDAAASKHYLLYGVADPDTNQVTLYAPANATDTFVFRSENVNVSGVYDNEPSDVAVLVVRRAGFTCTYTSTGDKIVGTYAGTLTDGYKCIGSVPVAAGSPLPATFSAMLDVWWTGANVPQSDAAVKALFESFNIAPLWYVAVDGPTHRFYPGPTDEWALLAAYSSALLGRTWPVPASAWPMQETVTPIDDKIGALDLTVIFATMNSAIGITGYTRKCLSFSAGGSKGQASFASGVGPNPTSQDFTLVGSYPTVVATTVLRQIMMLAGTLVSNEASLNINMIANGSELQAKATADILDDAAAFVAATPMRIYCRWVASTKTLSVFTKDRKFSVTASGSVTDGAKGFGGSIQNTPAFKLDHGHLHLVALTDQQIYDQTTILERAAPAWSP